MWIIQCALSPWVWYTIGCIVDICLIQSFPYRIKQLDGDTELNGRKEKAAYQNGHRFRRVAMVSFIKIFQPQKWLLQTMLYVGVKEHITHAAPAHAYRGKHPSERSVLGGRQTSPVQPFPVLSLKLSCHNAHCLVVTAFAWWKGERVAKPPYLLFSYCFLLFLLSHISKFLNAEIFRANAACFLFFFFPFFACVLPWTTAHDLVLSFNCYCNMNFNSN